MRSSEVREMGYALCEVCLYVRLAPSSVGGVNQFRKRTRRCLPAIAWSCCETHHFLHRIWGDPLPLLQGGARSSSEPIKYAVLASKWPHIFVLVAPGLSLIQSGPIRPQHLGPEDKAQNHLLLSYSPSPSLTTRLLLAYPNDGYRLMVMFPGFT